VIHPAWHHCGLGQYLLQQIQQHCQALGMAAVGSSFGATASLLRFWTAQGFLPVKLSAQAEQASGEPSVLVLKSCNASQQPIVAHLQQQFAAQLYWQLADSQRRLNPALALLLCQPTVVAAAGLPTDVSTNASALPQLALFAAGKRPYELVELLLLDWFAQHAGRLPHDIAILLVQKLWQKHSWAELSAEHGGTGKAQLIERIRQAVASLLTVHP
jgi:tRNA(Met) cytidine acetyltransferase